MASPSNKTNQIKLSVKLTYGANVFLWKIQWVLSPKFRKDLDMRGELLSYGVFVTEHRGPGASNRRWYLLIHRAGTNLVLPVSSKTGHHSSITTRNTTNHTWWIPFRELHTYYHGPLTLNPRWVALPTDISLPTNSITHCTLITATPIIFNTNH